MKSQMEESFKMNKMGVSAAIKHPSVAKAKESSGFILPDVMEIDLPDSSFTQSSSPNLNPEGQLPDLALSGFQLTARKRAIDMMSAEETGKRKGLSSFAMFSVLPQIISYLRKDDLFRFMMVNKDFYFEAIRILYKELHWDIYDEACNSLFVRLALTTSRYNSSIEFTRIRPQIVYLQCLYIHVTSSPWDCEYETDFRLGVLPAVLSKLKHLRKLSIADCRDTKKYGNLSQMSNLLEEIVWGEGTAHLETFEVVVEQHLTFFTSLMTTSDNPTTLSPNPKIHKKRRPSIKHFTLKGTAAIDTHNTAVLAFEYQIAYLLLILSPSLTHLTLLGLPKPQYLACPFDVGIGSWGGSVGKIFEILGPRSLRYLEELTIEGADTRYEVAEEAIVSWLTERSIYVKSATDDELRRKMLKAQEKVLQETEQAQSSTVQNPLSRELRWKLFDRYHQEDYEDEEELHLNCNDTCPIHGSTSGTFTLQHKQGRQMLHANPLLRIQSPARKFRYLHLFNCPEPWPAFYTIGCLHPPSTMHFSSPWLDASFTDIPNSLRKTGIERSRFANSLRKPYGSSPVFPTFNQGSFIMGVDHSGERSPRGRPSATTRSQCRKMRKKLQAYMSILEGVPIGALSARSSLAQVVAVNTKHIELRCLERVSMNMLESVVRWYGEGLEIVGMSRLDGTYKEASARGHVRGWGKILGHCKKLKELRIVWNLFDVVDWEKEKGSGERIKFGIGERSIGGKETMISFSEAEWWEGGSRSTTGKQQYVKEDSPSSDLDNGEGPSTQRSSPAALSESSSTISVDKSSESREEEDTKPDDTQIQLIPVKWVTAWSEWPQLKTFFPPDATTRSYMTQHADQYLMPASQSSSEEAKSDQIHVYMKELLMFLMDWRFRKLHKPTAKNSQEFRMREYTGDENPQSNVTEQSAAAKDTGLGNGESSYREASQSYQRQLRNIRRRTGFFCVTDGRANIPRDVYPVLETDTSYRYLPIERHNGGIFLERLKEEYLKRETMLASTIWEAIDSELGNETVVNKADWRTRFLVKTAIDNLKIPKGIIFTNRKYNEYAGDTASYKDPTRRLGPWEVALNELLMHEPPVFSPQMSKDTEALHRTIAQQLSNFFYQINLWHRRLRLEAALGKGLKRFCELSWVMFEEVATLEEIVGLLDNGREVTAHPIRSWGGDGGKMVVEMVKIRCWNCGGGWAGDYRAGTNGHGKAPVRIRVGARECRCQYPSAHNDDSVA